MMLAETRSVVENSLQIFDLGSNHSEAHSGNKDKRKMLNEKLWWTWTHFGPVEACKYLNRGKMFTFNEPVGNNGVEENWWINA